MCCAFVFSSDYFLLPHKVMIKVALIPIGLIILAALFWQEGAIPWESATLSHPLGTDEFGRDILSTLCIAVLNSAWKGGALAFLAVVVGLLVGYGMAMVESRVMTRFVVLTTLIIESIPLLLWIMVMIIALPFPNIVLVLAFSIGTMPLVSRVVAGEMERVKDIPFIKAARLYGASRMYCTIRHIIPNSLSVVAPLFVQLSGAGAAADGVFGLIGLGNRTSLDIGTLLLRGKENALLYPQMLAFAILSVAALFCFFWYVSYRIGLSRTNRLTLG